MATVGDEPKTKAIKKATQNKYPDWAPRFWHGMLFSDWVKLMARNRFRIHPFRLFLAGNITCLAVFNSAMRVVQSTIHGRKIDETEIEHPPVFIIGHWRSGTTFLHELMVRDKRFTYPTTYECYAPNHFLVTRRVFPTIVGFLLPRKRPMDNMGAGIKNPQEDEFALANLGCPSPYWRMAFPNEPPCYMELLDMEGVSDELLARWKHDMLWFAKALTYQTPKPLILKSPPHTGRVQVLAELFPGAKFIHITRHPETLFASTRRLWPSLDMAQGLQHPHHEHLDEYIFTAFERMYHGFESQRGSIDPRNICDVRYEDIARDPVGQVQAIYERLELGDFEGFRSDLEAYVAELKDYQPNRHVELEPEIRSEIHRRWAGYFEKYGY
jgi:omega-hydroxy-beta-dihydromenaquinone-9 sulfotransferase